jgi:hypothetical protein
VGAVTVNSRYRRYTALLLTWEGRWAYSQEFGEKEAEKVWSFVHKAVELDEAKRAEGCDLDEFQAHRFLEHFKETLTVQVPYRPLPHLLPSSSPILSSSLFVARCLTKLIRLLTCQTPSELNFANDANK